ncbi:MAG: Ig-like domain-containing protein [Chloroflexota bacterium]|nr:Ig-like domain-containing protein [Chloroflexota bacterium]
MSLVRSYRGAIAAIVSCALVIGVVAVGAPALLAGRLPSIGEPPGLAITPAGDDVARLSPITVRFPDAPRTRAGDALLRLEPAVHGTYAWLSTRTLLFQPDFPGLLRGASYSVVVPGGAASGLPTDVRRKFTVTGALTVQQIIPGDGDDQVPLNAQVLVQFSRSVAPLTTLAARTAAPVISFDPPLHGKGEWLNTAIYRFVPSDLQPATTYSVTVAKGLTSAADGVLPADVHTTFTTITPHVASIDPADNSQYASPTQQVTVTFDQPMDPSAASGIAVRDQSGNAVAGAVAWSGDATTATFTPAGELVRQGVYIVSVEKGLRGARGGETSALRTSSFRVVGLPAVRTTSPRDGDSGAGRYGVNIRFASPMDKASLEGKLRISGLTADDLDGRVFSDEGGIVANVELKPSTRYDVDLAAGAEDRYGQVMGAYHFSFTTGALPSAVSFALPGYMPTVTYSSSTDQILPFHATNTPAATFTLYPLTKDEGRTLMSGAPRSGQFEPSRPALRSWTEQVTGGKDEVLLGSTSLGGGKPLPKGYYFVRGGGEYRSEAAIAVVDTEIVTKLSVDELTAWVLDHDTGKPVSGVTVSATGAGVSPASATTDDSGLVSFSVPKPVIGTNIDRSYLLTIDDGSRFGIGSTRWSNGTSPYQFGLPADYFARTYVGQLYTDRPIYRPGETVDYKGIVRTDDDASYAVPGDVPLELVIVNPRGQQVKQEDVRLSAFGTFAGTFELPSDAPLGTYFLNVRMKSSDPRRQFGIFGNSFSIAEFRKPEYQVDVAAAKPSYVDGDRIDARTTATFFFGGALANASVQWSALGYPYSIQVKGFERYSFSDADAALQSVRHDPFRASGTATTDASGVATFSVPATLPPGGTAQQLTISATVTDQNAQAVAGSTTVTVHPASVYAGVRPAQYVAQQGRDAEIDLVTVDTDGKILPSQAVTVQIYDRRWITTKEETPGGGRIYRSVPRDTLLATLPATTDAQGLASVTYAPTKPGMLRVVALAVDAQGRSSRSATMLWVAGTGFASWQITNDDAIKLVADKDQYDVGDTASVLVPAPFEGAIGLVTVERGKVITRGVRSFPSNSERLSIPIDDHSVPNVFVSVVLYRPPTPTDPIPRYKVGYVELKVSTATRALSVTATPDKAQAKPGDTVHYAIKVTDARGRGVRAELSVAVVDKAVLALADERGPDGLHAFWFERGLGVTTASSLSVSMDRANDVIADAPRGGKGGSGSGLAGDQTRKDFRNTAFWTAQLVTGDDGTASVDVVMPDNLTTWRLQARAVSGDTLVGEGTTETLVTQPLLVRPALPRFLRIGDTTQLRALVRNGTAADASVDVTLEAQGVRATGGTQTLRIAAGATALVSWPATVDTEGAATITFRASGGGQSDAVSETLPVELDVTPETTATGGVVTDQPGLEAVYLPPFARTTPGSLTVGVDSALAGSMADELASLAPTDYEGSERVASRLIATIGVRRAEKSAVGASTQYDARIASDLAGLVGRQRPDGGWSWCDQPLCATDPYVTGWALLALGEAKRDGMSIDPGVVSRATSYVQGVLGQPFDVAAPPQPVKGTPAPQPYPFKPGVASVTPIQADPSERAFLLAGVASASLAASETSSPGSPALSPARALFEQYRTQLTSWGRGYLLLALHDAGVAGDDPTMRALQNDVAAAELPSATGAHWEDVSRGSFMSGTGTTALVGLALARVAPEQQLLPQAVRWLVVARGADGWRTSIDRALGILSLTTYAAGTGELAGDYSYEVTLGDRQLLAGIVSAGQVMKTATAPLPLTVLTPGKVGIVSFDRDFARPGRLYYTLDLRYTTPAKDVEALDRGFAISREYTTLDDPDTPLTTVKLGETVRVKVTVIAPEDRSYVTIDDLLPAGLEPVDTQLKTVDPRLRAQLDAERAAAFEKRTGFVAPWYRWYYSPWQRVETHDDRVVLGADRLQRGVYEYVYYARATTPGDFFVAPAQAEEMYFPEVFGRSDSSRFTVTP